MVQQTEAYQFSEKNYVQFKLISMEKIIIEDYNKSVDHQHIQP